MKELTEEEKAFIKAKLEKTLKISTKRRENKEKLIDDIINMFKDDLYNYEETLLDLAEEALKTRTQKELKSYL